MRAVHWLSRAWFVVLVLAITSKPAVPVAGAPEDELPDGDGKKILQAQCTSCHELTEVTKFRGYYNRAQWHDIVVTMVEYGADLKKTEIETLTDYLTRHLGRQ